MSAPPAGADEDEARGIEAEAGEAGCVKVDLRGAPQGRSAGHSVLTKTAGDQMEGKAGGRPISRACLDDLMERAEIEPASRQSLVHRVEAKRKNAGLLLPSASFEFAEALAKEGDVAGPCPAPGQAAVGTAWRAHRSRLLFLFCSIVATRICQEPRPNQPVFSACLHGGEAQTHVIRAPASVGIAQMRGESISYLA